MIGLIGISHHTASQDERGQFALTETEAIHLVGDWIALGYLRGAIVLSTCNRVEIYCELTKNCTKAINSLLDSWLTNLELRDKMRSRVSVALGEEVYHHLFRLTSGMESMVIGETQILGQVKDAFRLAVGEGQSSPTLSRLFHKAFEIAKRIRSQYLVSVVPLSAASRAVDLIYDSLPNAAQMSVLILGAGQMAEATLEHLGRKSISGTISIYNRTRERAEKLANRIPRLCIYSGDELPEALGSAEIVFVTTSASSPIIQIEHLRERTHKIVLFDLAVPRNVSPEVATLTGVTLYSIDDLSGQAINQPQQELLTAANEIVSQGVQEFCNWLDASEVRQVIGLIQQTMDRLLASETNLLPNELSDEHRRLIALHMEHLRTTYTTALASSLRELQEERRINHIDAIGTLFNHILGKLNQ